MIGTIRYEVDLSRLRLAGSALLVGGLVFAHLPEAWGLPCPLRSLTGVPCPFCGTTTAVRDALGGHVGASAAAAPLGLLVVVAAFLAVISRLPKRIAFHPAYLLVPLLAEWVFELHRFRVL
jgi:hypothetical protein